jgi:putative membrane protein
MWLFSRGLRRKMSERQDRQPVLLANGGIAPGPHHVHPAHVLLNAGRVVLVILISALFSSSGAFSALSQPDFDSGLRGLIVLGIVGLFLIIIALIVLFSYLSYRRFLWEITEADIHVYSGIIFKKQVHIPFARVQSIDFNADVVDRVLGLVKLKVETAGGAANRGVVIPALRLGEAEALRGEVFARKRVSEQKQEALLRQKVQATTGADALVQEVGDEAAALRGIFAEDYHESTPIEYEYGLSARELFLASLSGDHNLVLFLALGGVATQLWQLAESFGLGDEAVHAVTSAVSNQTTATITVMAIVVLLIVFIVSLVVGVLGTALSYGAFKARRRGGRIEVERGLLTRQYKGVAISRVQAVELHQGFIRRLIGYTEVTLHTIDSVDTNSNQQNAQALQGSGLVVHPFIKLNKVAGILEGLLPEFNSRPAPHELRPLPKVALRRSLIRGGVFPTLIYALIATGGTLFLTLSELAPANTARAIVITLWALVAVLGLLHLIGSVLWYRHAAYAYNTGMLTVRQGAYGMTSTVIPRRKIQWAATRQNPFQRLSKVMTISATTAAGTSGTTLVLRDLSEAEASAYLDWLRPRPQGGTD